LNDDLNAIHSFVVGGGRLVVANYDIDAVPAHPLWATLGGQYESDLTSPVQLQFRVPGHPIFNTPNAIGALIPTGDAVDNGDYMSALPNGTTLVGAIGGDPARSLTIVGDSNRTLLNSWLPFDFQGDPDIIPFLENQILFVIPEPSTLVLLATGSAGLLAYALRRRRRTA
jgi:hypothetical protein